jgi:hypothetical protein
MTDFNIQPAAVERVDVGILACPKSKTVTSGIETTKAIRGD